MKRLTFAAFLILIILFFMGCDASLQPGNIYIKNNTSKEIALIKIDTIEVKDVTAYTERTTPIYRSITNAIIKIENFTPPDGKVGVINLTNNSIYTLTLYKSPDGEYHFNMQGMIFDENGTVENMR